MPAACLPSTLTFHPIICADCCSDPGRCQCFTCADCGGAEDRCICCVTRDRCGEAAWMEDGYGDRFETLCFECYKDRNHHN